MGSWRCLVLLHFAGTAAPAAPKHFTRYPLPCVSQVVCYIYFTRIIVYLLESTLPFHFIWLAAAASELATLAFYIASGVSFRCGRGGVAGVCMGGLEGGPQPHSPACWPCCRLTPRPLDLSPPRPATHRPMPAGSNPYFQLTEEEAIELTKAEMEENP